jgi:hypothetical protein
MIYQLMIKICRNYLFAMRTTWFRLFLHEQLRSILKMISYRNPWIRPRFTVKILKFHNCIDFFRKCLDKNIHTRNKYKVHDREISSHLFNILNVWSIHILHIFMLQRCRYYFKGLFTVPYCSIILTDFLHFYFS